MKSLKEMLDEAAKSFVENYVTMNNRPPHRPDVMEYCHQQGALAATKLILESDAIKDLLIIGDYVIENTVKGSFAERSTTQILENFYKFKKEAMEE